MPDFTLFDFSKTSKKNVIKPKIDVMIKLIFIIFT
jgi:hypothetical protein